ncbi:MAG: hypothetical protein L3J51_01050 [Cocleimonas sp.]|nr:hypothetical protein [Cocleimonas sp.]
MFALMFSIVGCNSSVDRVSVLQKCTTLGDESIGYARANYVKLFHYFNAEKFSTPFQQVKDYDYVTHRNVINTYDIAVRKLKGKDPITKSLLSACKNLSEFSKNFVDQAYPRAIAHKSQENPLSDKFFTQINQIVKFDETIGVFDRTMTSFKQQVASYEAAAKKYRKIFKKELLNN